MSLKSLIAISKIEKSIECYKKGVITKGVCMHKISEAFNDLQKGIEWKF